MRMKELTREVQLPAILISHPKPGAPKVQMKVELEKNLVPSLTRRWKNLEISGIGGQLLQIT
jgi:hypothetical protein